MTQPGGSDLDARDQAILGCDTGRCDSCANLGAERQVCPASERDCGHHCNHSWSHERCCWCGEEWGEE